VTCCSLESLRRVTLGRTAQGREPDGVARLLRERGVELFEVETGWGHHVTWAGTASWLSDHRSVASQE